MGCIGEVGFREVGVVEAAVGEIRACAIGLRQIGLGKIDIFGETMGEGHLSEC